MVEPNYQNLPAPMGFSIDFDNLELWNYSPDSNSQDDETKLGLAFSTPTIDMWLVEIPAGDSLPWHTHEPHTSQVYWLLQGMLRANYKDREGEIHSYEAKAADEELVYLPAGAHNQIDSIGDEKLRFISVKEGGGTVNGRLDHLFGKPKGHYDPTTDPKSPGLDISPTRGHIFDKQSNAVERY